MCRSLFRFSLLLTVLGLLVLGCVRADPARMVIHSMQFHGVVHVSEKELRDKISTREPSRTLGILLPWTPPEYYDPTNFRRDIERIERLYQSQGYYHAAVVSTRVDPINDHEVTISVGVREGMPVRVHSVWISGCDADDTSPRDATWEPSPGVCQRIKSGLRLNAGATLSEWSLDADKAFIRGVLDDFGYPGASVVGRATVSPDGEHAFVNFSMRPGLPARFGSFTIVERDRGQPVNGLLPVSKYPIGPVENILQSLVGQKYSSTDLAEAQRRIYALGAFGLVTFENEPVTCNDAGQCGSAIRGTSPESLHLEMKYKVHLTPPKQSYRFRMGFGFEGDASRTNGHGVLSYENMNFFGGLRRLRLEFRPLLFLPGFSSAPGQAVDGGVMLSAELRQPEICRGCTLISSISEEYGPDSVNPALTSRNRLAGALGMQFRINRSLIVSTFLRSTWLYFTNSDPFLRIDPIYREQYRSQAFTYAEVQLTNDARDNTIMPRSGWYFSGLLQLSLQIPYINAFTFARGSLDARGYVPLHRNVVLAFRGFAGAAIGTSTEPWPVPQELRFYSGGANSNRGYPVNRAGWVSAVPRQECRNSSGEVQVDCFQRRPDLTYNLSPDPNTGQLLDERRLTAVGGLLSWELSAELRFYFGDLGAVLFFDTSDVRGWSPSSAGRDYVQSGDIPQRNVTVNATDTAPMVPSPDFLKFSGIDPHPSAGIGLRYVTSVGVVRLDLGLRLDDLLNGCTTFDRDIASAGSRPWFFAVSRPRCDLFGFTVPLALHLALGEAY